MSIGIKFSEEMKGRLVAGADDPLARSEADLEAGDETVLSATVSVPDLDAFIADKNHLGGLYGGVSYPPLPRLQANRPGLFNLFSPGASADEKLMVYELGLEADGQDYYFAGRKEVRDDPGFDVWSDTTTLFTSLHRGADKSGEIVASGVLRLNALDLAELLSTLEVTGTDELSAKAEAVAKFGKFFAGELWDSYGPGILHDR